MTDLNSSSIEISNESRRETSPAIRVAVVDDDPSVRSGISRLLRSHGFSCFPFESGESLLNAPNLGDLDCLILDIHLPGIDGFETRDRLSRVIGLPVIFITANPDVNSPGFRPRLKGRPCLSKPFEANDLIDTIQQTLGE